MVQVRYALPSRSLSYSRANGKNTELETLILLLLENGGENGMFMQGETLEQQQVKGDMNERCWAKGER